MKNKQPLFRCGTKEAIDELVFEYGYPYAEWMQDWPYEIADPMEVDNYFQHYDEQSKDDNKFVLMQMLIQAVEEVDNDLVFNKHWIRLKKQLLKDFEIHEYTVYYWSFFDGDCEDNWKITPFMRELWNDVKER